MSGLDLSGVFKRDVRSVALFGFGRSAWALIPHLLSSGYRVTVRDDRQGISKELPQGVRYLFGNEATANMNEDIIIFAPSVRRDRFQGTETARSAIFTSDTEIFFKLFSGKAFAVSGSSGKSTTCTMLYEILSSAGDAHLIGNIGVPMTDALLSENPTRAVCEISSFNLQYDEIRAYRAAITNIKRNHLNWHKDFGEYTEAKRTLLSSSLCFSVNADDPLTSDLASSSSCYACFSLKFDYNSLHKRHKEKIIFTRTQNGIMRNGELIIPGDLIAEYPEHNVYNLLTALSLADGEYDVKALPSFISSHTPLPHRCEKFLTDSGICYIDSSIDTSPDRTLATLSSLSGDMILLLGGRSKGEGYEPLIPIIENKCKALFVFGEARDRIISELGHIGLPISVHATMREATLASLKRCGSGDILLLSPASTSYDEFSSFEERGNIFKKIITDAVRQKNTGDKNEKDN